MRVYIIVAGLALLLIGRVSGTVVEKGPTHRILGLRFRNRFVIRTKPGSPLM